MVCARPSTRRPAAVAWKDCRLAATEWFATQPNHGAGDIEVGDLKRIPGEMPVPCFRVLTAKLRSSIPPATVRFRASPTVLVPLTAMSLLSPIIAPQQPWPVRPLLQFPRLGPGTEKALWRVEPLKQGTEKPAPASPPQTPLSRPLAEPYPLQAERSSPPAVLRGALRPVRCR